MSTVEPNKTVDGTTTSRWLLPTFWIVAGSGFYLGATQITTAIVQDKHDPGPAAMCMLCAAALVLLGITQAVQQILNKPNTVDPKTSAQFDDVHSTCTSRISPIALQQALLGVAAIAIYIFAVFQIGFGLATLVFGIVSIKSLGASWLSTLLATATCIATVYLVFIELLGILLPTGRWDFPF